MTKYAYDPRGALTGVSDAKNHTRQYAYDALGRLVSSTDALGHSQQIAYDANGNRTSLLDATGKSTTFAYDAEDRLTAIAYPDGQHTQYTYDGAGRRTSLADSLGTTTYQYDALGELTRVADPFGKVLQYAYDPNGNRSGLTYPDGSQVHYAYDSLNRLTQVTEARGSTDRYTYDAVGNPTGLQLANGTRWQATYDALNRPLSKRTLDGRAQVQSSFAYTYDARGNMLSETTADARHGDDARSRGADQLTYSYDALDRLVSSGRGGFQTRYQYDAVGNRLDVSTLFGEHRDASDRDDQARGLQAQYDAANELTAIVGPDGRPLVSYSYDARGNLLNRSGFGDPVSYTWDAANRLTSVTSGEDQSLKTSYRYDGDGRLYQEQTALAGDQRDMGDAADRLGATVTYTLDQASRLSQVVSATNGRESATYLYGLERIAGTSGRNTVYYGTDVRGSVRTLSDARGHLLATRAYDPFGVPLGGRGGGDDSEGVFGHLDGEGRLAGRGNLLGQFGYTGERQDPTTGLVNLRARWYQPASARFLSRDTFPGLLRDPVSQNAYLYGGANPTTFVDPSGHFKQLIQQIAPGADFYSNPLFQAVAGAAPTQFAAGVGSGAIDQLLSLPEGLANLGMAYIQYAIQNPTQADPASFAQYMGGRLIEHRGEILMGLSQAIGSTSDDLRSGDPYRVGHAVGEVVTGVALVVLPAGELKAAAEGAGAAEAAGATGDGIVYLRTDLSGSLKPYVGQAKNFDRFLARQAEHAASHPQSVFDFEILDQGIAKADLERFEQFYISGYGGPTTKTSVGGLSNARNQMSWTRYIAAGGDAGIP